MAPKKSKGGKPQGTYAARSDAAEYQGQQQSNPYSQSWQYSESSQQQLQGGGLPNGSAQSWDHYPRQEQQHDQGALHHTPLFGAHTTQQWQPQLAQQRGANPHTQASSEVQRHQQQMQKQFEADKRHQQPCPADARQQKRLRQQRMVEQHKRGGDREEKEKVGTIPTKKEKYKDGSGEAERYSLVGESTNGGEDAIQFSDNKFDPREKSSEGPTTTTNEEKSTVAQYNLSPRNVFDISSPKPKGGKSSSPEATPEGGCLNPEVSGGDSKHEDKAEANNNRFNRYFETFKAALDKMKTEMFKADIASLIEQVRGLKDCVFEEERWMSTWKKFDDLRKNIEEHSSNIQQLSAVKKLLGVAQYSLSRLGEMKLKSGENLALFKKEACVFVTSSKCVQRAKSLVPQVPQIMPIAEQLTSSTLKMIDKYNIIEKALWVDEKLGLSNAAVRVDNRIGLADKIDATVDKVQTVCKNEKVSHMIDRARSVDEKLSSGRVQLATEYGYGTLSKYWKLYGDYKNTVKVPLAA